MTEWPFSIFEDKKSKPTQTQLDEALGRSTTHWKALVEHAKSEYAPLVEEWGFSGAKWGWSLRLKQKKRAIVYLTPRAKHFVAGFALGEEAVAALRDEGLPKAVQQVIDEAPRYAEGRGVRLEVRTKRDLEAVKRIAAAKMGS